MRLLVALPLVTLGNAVLRLQRGDVRRRQLGGVVVDMPGNRQPPALDGVRHDDDRAVGNGFGFGERPENLRDVVPAEVHQQVLEGGVGHVSQHAFHVGSRELAPLDDSAANFRAVGVQQRLVLGVAAGIDPMAQPLAARPLEEFQLLAAVLEPQHLPAFRLEQPRDLRHLAFRGDVVEALAVDVDDPPQVVQPIGAGLADGFRDVALVDLGVTH